jgi:AcrR family transcriptional regulator
MQEIIMARNVKPDEYASKRRAILDAAQRQMITIGYERMAIQDIMDELHISSRVFHACERNKGSVELVTGDTQ